MLLSLFVCFHLFVITIAPAPESRIFFYTNRFFQPYAGFFEFAATWNFFAPQPDPPVHTIRWELLDEKGDQISTDSMPHLPDDQFFFRDRYNKRVTMTRFASASSERIESIFGNYLCKLDSRAKSVRIWQGIYLIPKLDEIRQKKRNINDFEKTDVRSIAHVYCDQIRKPKEPSQYQQLSADPKPAVSSEGIENTKGSQL